MLRLSFVLGCGLVLVSCASTPKFEPRRPIDETESFREGLLLCHEYNMPTPGRHPNVLKPYIQCLKQVQETFARIETHPLFRTFFNDLKWKYEISHVPGFSPVIAQEYDSAIRAILRLLWRDDGKNWTLTQVEKENIRIHFPLTYRVLRNRTLFVISRKDVDSELDSEVEWLRARALDLKTFPQAEPILSDLENLKQDLTSIEQVDSHSDVRSYVLERILKKKEELNQVFFGVAKRDQP